MTKNTWLVVANASIARIFRVPTIKSLIEVEVLKHPESRLHTRDLVTDKPGRGFESRGTARHNLDQQTSPKEQEYLVFAKDICNYLDIVRNNGEIDRLYIAAGPNLLGLIRQNLHPTTAKLVQGELDKDMTHMSPEEILALLPF